MLKKPFLDQKNTLENTNQIECIIISSYVIPMDRKDILVSNVPGENIYTKKRFAVDACNEDLLAIDGNISDNEIIYNIETISLPDVEINYHEQVETLINQFVELMQNFKIECKEHDWIRQRGFN
jgi:hypothetical protein